MKNEPRTPLFENNFKIITKGIYSPDLTYKTFENQEKISLCKYLGCVIPFFVQFGIKDFRIRIFCRIFHLFFVNAPILTKRSTVYN